MTWQKQRVPSPRALLAAPRPLRVPRPCQEALAHPVQTGLFTGEEPQTRGEEVSPASTASRWHGLCAPGPGSVLCPAATLSLSAPGEGRVTLQVLFSEFGGSHRSLAARTVQREVGDWLVALCPGHSPGRWSVPAGKAQPRQVSILLLVVLALQGTERRAG